MNKTHLRTSTVQLVHKKTIIVPLSTEKGKMKKGGRKKTDITVKTDFQTQSLHKKRQRNIEKGGVRIVSEAAKYFPVSIGNA